MNTKFNFLSFLVFYFLFFSNCGYSQSFSFKHYSIEDGLNSATVYWATQGPQGYMWFGTEEGVCRFDGKVFTKFTVDDGLSDNEIFQVATDSKKRIWFLTFNGHLSYYVNGKFCNESNTPWLKKTFAGKSYVSFFEDSKGRLFFGSIGDIITIVEKDSTVKIMHTKESFNGYNFYEVPGAVLIYCGYSCLRYDGKSLLQIPLQRKRYGGYYFITSYKNHQFYFSKDGIIRGENENEKIIIPAGELPPVLSITGFHELKDSGFMISSRHGAILFPYGIIKKENATSFLNGKTILSVGSDNEKNLWFCTENEGVYMLQVNHLGFSNYTLSEGLKSEMINRVTKDNHGNTWLGCANTYLTKISNKGIENFQVKSLVSRRTRVLDIVIDPRDNIYAATDDGVVQITPQGEQKIIPVLYKDMRLQSYSAKSISMNSDGSLNATLYLGPCKTENFSGSHEKVFKALIDTNHNVRTYAHFVDKSGKLWLSDINGLNLWDNHQLISYAHIDPLLEKRMLSISATEDSVLLLSTEGYGIIFFKGGKIINRLTKENGLSSNVCRRTFIEGDTIWICTNSGLNRICYKNNKISDIHLYNVNSGLLSNDVRDVYDDGEKIFVATSKGLCIFNEYGKISSISAPPQLIITEISSGKLLFAGSDSVTLSYRNNHVRLSFIAITFQSPDEIKYQYRISGSQNDWIETENNSLEFSGVNPGYYPIELRAKKADSGWSPVVHASFTIVPPFWRKKSFVFTMLFISFIFSIAIIWFFINRKFTHQLEIVKHEEMIEKERIRIATDMHDDLGSDLTKIAIVSEVIKENAGMTTGEVNQNLEKIIYFATDLRKKMDEIIWALNPRYDSVGNLLSFIHEYADNYFDNTEINCKVYIRENIPEKNITSFIKRNVFLVVKETLHNILRHAGATDVKIELYYAANRIKIQIHDNGKGFEAAALGSQGNGLYNIKKRMKDINGEILINSVSGNGCSIYLTCEV